MDLLSHEYGWTTEYILSRTFKEIDYRLYAIDRRRKQQLKTTAKLHGREIKGLVIPKRKTLQKAEEKSDAEIYMEKKIQRAFEQRMREHGGKTSV